MKPSRVFAFLKMYPVSQVSMMGVPLSGYLGRLPRWGWMRNGDIFEQQILERPTSANDGGSWLTPTTGDAQSRTVGQGTAYLTETGTVRRKNADGTSSNLGLARMVNWATPQSRDWKGRSGRSGKGTETDLPSTTESTGYKLNPDWVELLLGLPQGWTDLTEGED